MPFQGNYKGGDGKVLEKFYPHLFLYTKQLIANLRRYDTLVSTHLHLLNREGDNQDRLEKEKANLMKFVEEKNNDIMSYNNQLANLQVQRSERAEIEGLVINITFR